MVLLLPLSLFTVTILPSKAPPAGALLARAHLPTPHSRTAADSNVLTAPTTDVFCRCLVAKNETRTYNSYYDDWSVMCVCVDLKKRKRLFWVTKWWPIPKQPASNFGALHFRGAFLLTKISGLSSSIIKVWSKKDQRTTGTHVLCPNLEEA